jgi:uncharacterized protein YegP (UPF0339 family)
VSDGPNTANDYAEVYQRADGLYDWRRVDGANGHVVATSGGQGYVKRLYAATAAEAYCPGIEVVSALLGYDPPLRRTREDGK